MRDDKSESRNVRIEAGVIFVLLIVAVGHLLFDLF